MLNSKHARHCWLWQNQLCVGSCNMNTRRNAFRSDFFCTHHYAHTATFVYVWSHADFLGLGCLPPREESDLLHARHCWLWQTLLEMSLCDIQQEVEAVTLFIKFWLDLARPVWACKPNCERQLANSMQIRHNTSSNDDFTEETSSLRTPHECL